jgi:hypothetical protein
VFALFVREKKPYCGAKGNETRFYLARAEVTVGQNTLVDRGKNHSKRMGREKYLVDRVTMSEGKRGTMKVSPRFTTPLHGAGELARDKVGQVGFVLVSLAVSDHSIDIELLYAQVSIQKVYTTAKRFCQHKPKIGPNPTLVSPAAKSPSVAVPSISAK